MTLMTNDLNDHFFGGRGKGETQNRRRKRKRKPVGVPADLKSASSEVAFLPPVLLADYKSAIVTHTAADCKSAETEGDRREKREREERKS